MSRFRLDLVTIPTPAKDKIIVALDVPDETAAVRLVGQLAPEITFFKIGLELFTRCGPQIVKRVREAGGDSRIFLDLKLHDIPNTVARAVAAAGALEVDFLTIHLAGGGAMLRAAAAEAEGGKMRLLGVTVLTSMDAADLDQTGIGGSLEQQVIRLARLGMDSGLRGLVASPLEIAPLRRSLLTPLTLVIPGVRPGTAVAADDQQRVMTPAQALEAGADFLVIGRPITAQPDPRAAAARILADLA
jgi:orotidine-5'-phosphate decarboxylase